MRSVLTHCCRGYAAIAVIAAGVTASWGLGVIDVSISLLGYAWFGVAAAGTFVAVGMAVNRAEALVVDSTAERIEAFENSAITGRPFEFYIGALAAWAAVSFGWVLGGMSVSTLAIVGYGWLAIAAYGLAICVGIAMNHIEDVAIAVNPTERLERDG